MTSNLGIPNGLRPDEPLLGQKKLGKRFKLLRRTWSAGASHVFQVFDRSKNRTLALRLLGWTEDARAIARFKQEFRVLSELRHPNIVEVYDFEVIPGDCYFFTMEHCPGRFLHNYFQPCDFRRLISVFWEICQTLDFIHSRGVLLGNLTPHSILVHDVTDSASAGGTGDPGGSSPSETVATQVPRAHVIPAAPAATESPAIATLIPGILPVGTLGPAVPAGGDLTRPEAGIRFVTLGIETELRLDRNEVSDGLHYMPPEAAVGRQVDPRANLYSLGVILYELMTGFRPFEAESSVELMKQHLRAAPVPPRQVRADVPIELENIVLRLLEKRPSRRYQTAHDVAMALAEAGSYIVSEEARPFKTNFVFSSEFIGREKEFDKLKGAYHSARQGRGGLVLVTGEAGIGKTRLVQEFKLYLQLEGEVVLQTRSFERARAPFQEVNELIGQLLIRFEKTQSGLVEHYRSEGLGSPQVVSVLRPETDGGAGTVRRQVLEALGDIFLEFSTAQPFVMILDDLHLSDEETVEFLNGLATKLQHHPILLVLVFESLQAEAARPLGALVAAARKASLAEPMELVRLTRDETAQLVQSLLGINYQPPRLTKLIHQETEGNPFFIEEVVKYLVDERLIERRGTDWDLMVPDISLLRIPGSIVDAISRRLEALDSLELELVKILAVYGQSMDLPTLVEVSGYETGRLQSALLELQSRQLVSLQEGTEGSRYLFAHAKIGEVLYQKMDPMLRRLLHVRFAESLIRRHGDKEPALYEAIAHHCLEGRLADKAVEWALRAARAAAQLFAFRNAIDDYERVIEEIGVPGRELHRSAYEAALEEVSDLYAQGGENQKAIRRYGQLLQEPLPLVRRAEVERKIGRCHLMESNYDLALRHYRLCLDELEKAGEVRQLAMLYAEIGRAEALRGQVGVALESCILAMQLLSDTSESREIGELGLVTSFCHIELGQGHRALDQSREAMAIFEKHDDLLSIGKALALFGLAYATLGQSAPATESFEKALRLFERLGYRFGQATVDTALGTTLYRLTSSWERAGELLERGAALSRAIGDRDGVHVASTALAQIAIDRGRLTEAKKLLDEVLSELDEHSGPPGAVAQARQVLGAWHLRRREWASAMTELRKALSADVACGLDLAASHCRLLLAELLLVSGASDDAVRFLDEVQPDLESRQNQRELLIALRLRGLAELAGGRPGSGLELLRRSERMAKELGCEPELGKTFVALAAYHSQTHDPRGAAEMLKKAEHLFRDLGALGLVGDVERRIALLQEETTSKLRRPDDPSLEIYQLYRISQLLSPILDSHLLMTRLLELAVESVGASRGLLVESRRESLQVVARHGFEDEELEAFSQSIVRRVLTEGKGLLSSEATEDPRFAANLSIELLEVRSVLCVPLRIGEKDEAVLYLTADGSGRVFSERDLSFLSAVANHASVALKNVVLYERYKSIMEGLDSGVVVMDRDSRVRDYSRAAETILGLEDAAVLGHRAEDCFRQGAETELGAVMVETLRRGEPVHRELGFRRRGELGGRFLDVTASLLRDGWGETIGVTAVFEDVTDVKRLQAELELQRRLSAMGQLAAQVAHKMKNLLSGIKILAQGLRRECEDVTPEAEFVEEILSEVSSAEGTIYAQLSVSSAAEEQEELIEPGVLVSALVESLQASLVERGLIAEVDVAPELPLLRMRRKRMSDGLLGVLQNAIEASAPGGHIRVTARLEDRPEPGVDPAVRAQVRIEVEDRGVGIAPEHLGRIFDPFFTTKPGAQGVGLWLFHRAVEGLRGRVQVQSEPGQGTTVGCILPVPSEGRWEKLVQEPVAEA